MASVENTVTNMVFENNRTLSNGYIVEETATGLTIYDKEYKRLIVDCSNIGIDGLVLDGSRNVIAK